MDKSLLGDACHSLECLLDTMALFYRLEQGSPSVFLQGPHKLSHNSSMVGPLT